MLDLIFDFSVTLRRQWWVGKVCAIYGVRPTKQLGCRDLEPPHMAHLFHLRRTI